MDETERRKLEALLGHWAKHGAEHGEEFRGWAKKAGEASVRDPMLQAAQHMDQASELLLRALEALRE